MDVWVRESQEWLNDTYASVNAVPDVVADGYSGWQTMYALTRALQYELGIATPSDNFGTMTMTQLTSQVGSVTASTNRPNIIGLLQCALWCKGYFGGTVFAQWDSALNNSVPQMKSDLGLPATASVPPKVFKSLLTMDAYVQVSGGTPEVRLAQQWLNGRYLSRQDFQIVPCDGVFSRNVQTGLMYAIQYEIGMADGVANGNFGPGTQQGIRDYGIVAQGSTDGTKKFVSLFQVALAFNGYAQERNGIFDSATRSRVLDFQSFTELPGTGTANFQTWASLLVSSGDPSRPGTAADTSTPLSTATAAQLYVSGYRAVGRYLTVLQKRYQPGELDRIFNAGLTTFPIYQNAANSPSTFSEAIGYSEGVLAARRARQLGFRAGTTIYFAVDYDATSDDIPALVLPHFKGVKRGVETSSVPYKVGIYGTRNVCARVTAAGYAQSSFVSGMSTAYSGNLGFSLPSNWAYDQIKTLSIGSGVSNLEIDKNIMSVRAAPTAAVDATPLLPGPAFDEFFYWRLVEMQHQAEIAAKPAGDIGVEGCNEMILQNIQEPAYWDAEWQVYTPHNSTSYGYFAAQAEYKASPGEYPVTNGYPGDFRHLAASIRGYTQWGIPPLHAGWTISDFGAWGMDLATTWGKYAAERKSAGAPLPNAQTWFETHIAVDGAGDGDEKFAKSDFIANIDAYLVAVRIRGTGRTFADAMREILVSCAADPKWRFAQFYVQRFGSTRSNVVSAAKGILGSPWPYFVTQNWVGPRAPGVNSGLPGDPTSASELAQEQDLVAEGFADVLINFATGART